MPARRHATSHLLKGAFRLHDTTRATPVCISTASDPSDMYPPERERREREARERDERERREREARERGDIETTSYEPFEIDASASRPPSTGFNLSKSVSTGHRTEMGVVMPMVLPTVRRTGAPRS